MIDEKPFRVTNEQIFADTMCGMYCNDCDLSLSKPDEWSCQKGEAKVFDYAHDLHDARELINKQEAIIKEMRDAFTTIHQKSIAFVCEDVRTLARMQLEKSKDY